MTPEEYMHLKILKDHPQLWGQEHRAPCRYCSTPGMRTGLPGNVCENCMNTGYDEPTAEDLK